MKSLGFQGVLALSVIPVALAGCKSGGMVVPDASTSMVVPASNQSIFLRASFDDDPSPYIGHFLPDALAPGEIDENNAVKTRCSEFITFKEVNASGTFDEVFNSSSKVGASLGVMPVWKWQCSVHSQDVILCFHQGVLEWLQTDESPPLPSRLLHHRHFSW